MCPRFSSSEETFVWLLHNLILTLQWKTFQPKSVITTTSSRASPTQTLRHRKIYGYSQSNNMGTTANVLRIVNSKIRLTGLEICFGGGFSPFGWPWCVYALCLSTWGQNVSCTCSNEVSVTHFYSEGNSQQGSDGFFLISIITSAVPYWTNVPPGQDVSDIHEYVTFKPLRICHKGVGNFCDNQHIHLCV